MSPDERAEWERDVAVPSDFTGVHPVKLAPDAGTNASVPSMPREQRYAEAIVAERVEIAEAELAALRKAVEGLADEWQDVCDRGANGRHGYHNGEYGDNYAADLRAVLASVPAPTDEAGA